MSKVNELGKKVLDLIPESLREDLIDEIKNQLIEEGVVIEAPKKKTLSPQEVTEQIEKTVDQLMPGYKNLHKTSLP